MTNASTSVTTLTMGIDLGDRFSHCCVLDGVNDVIHLGGRDDLAPLPRCLSQP